MMARMTLMAFQIEGDAAEISAAMEMVQQQFSRIAPGETTKQIEVVRDATPAVESAPARKPRAEREKPREMPASTDSKKEPQGGSMQAKALETIRNSHYGVTSEEIQKVTSCATVQSAYQICLALQDKGLVKKTPDGAWKAVSG